jgi:hypothetical protein
MSNQPIKIESAREMIDRIGMEGRSIILNKTGIALLMEEYHSQFKTDPPVKEIDWNELQAKFGHEFVTSKFVRGMIDIRINGSPKTICNWFKREIGGEK